MTLSGEQAVQRFSDNEERVNKFTNETGNWTTNLGVSVETIQAFLARKDGEINQATQSVQWTFSTSTMMGNPGLGNIRFNNSIFSLVTQVAVSFESSLGKNITKLVQTWDDSTNPIKGSLLTSRIGSIGDFCYFDIVSITNNVLWFLISVEFVVDDGAFIQSNYIAASFIRAGDMGTNGTNGIDGQPGTNGIDGDSSFLVNYVFDPNVSMSEPSLGHIRFNNNDPALITTMSLSPNTNGVGNPDISDYINLWDDSTSTQGGSLITFLEEKTGVFVTVLVTSVQFTGVFFICNVTYVAHSGTLAQDNVIFGQVSVSGFDGVDGQDGIGAGDMIAANNLSDVSDHIASVQNLELGKVGPIISDSSIPTIPELGDYFSLFGDMTITLFIVEENRRFTVRAVANRTLEASSAIITIDGNDLVLNGGQTVVFQSIAENVVQVISVGSVGSANGEEVQWDVRNDFGSNIVAGQAVMAIGTLGASGKITIGLYDASVMINSEYLLGIAFEDIEDGGDGKVTHFGKVNDIDTSMWAEGVVLYPDQTIAGGLTDVEPITGINQPIAFVINSHAVNGVLAVRINVYNRNEHIKSVTLPVNDNIVTFDGVNGNLVKDSGKNIFSVGDMFAENNLSEVTDHIEAAQNLKIGVNGGIIYDLVIPTNGDFFIWDNDTNVDTVNFIVEADRKFTLKLVNEGTLLHSLSLLTIDSLKLVLKAEQTVTLQSFALNKVHVISVGQVSNVGKQTIYIPAGAWISRETDGAVSNSEEFGNYKVMVETKDFEPSINQYIQTSFQMPKSWNAGTITANFVWKHKDTSTNFDVLWGIQGISVGNGDSFHDTSFGVLEVALDTGASHNRVYISNETNQITLENPAVKSDWVILQAIRSSSQSIDTLAVDAMLIGVLINYTTDTSTDV